jgi:hypothetical protein
MAFRQSCGLEEDFFALGLTSRKNLCLHPIVSKERKNRGVDTKCRELTASWVRAAAGKTKGGDPSEPPPEQTPEQASIELCSFYEVGKWIMADHREYWKLTSVFIAATGGNKCAKSNSKRCIYLGRPERILQTNVILSILSRKKSGKTSEALLCPLFY